MGGKGGVMPIEKILRCRYSAVLIEDLNRLNNKSEMS